MGGSRARWLLTFAGALAAISFVVATAVAQGDDPGSVHACVNKATRVVRVIPAGKTCRRNEWPRNWDIRGAAGATGLPDPPAPPVP